MADTISMTVSSTAPGSKLTITLNSQMIWQGDPYGSRSVDYVIPLHAARYRLCIMLEGKTAQHTQIIDSVRVRDLLVDIQQITVNGVDLDHLITALARYSHNFNGTGATVQTKFFGTMGCNGQVDFEFRLPINFWVLENL